MATLRDCKLYFSVVLLVAFITAGYIINHFTNTMSVYQTQWTKQSQVREVKIPEKATFSTLRDITNKRTKTDIVSSRTLSAIAGGVKQIHLSREDLVQETNSTFHNVSIFRGLLYQGVKYFHLFRHFGQPFAFPHDNQDMNNVTDEYIIGPWRTPAIQQGICNNTVNDVKFDLSNPPVAVRIGVYSPFLPCDTLFRHDALWSILLFRLNICSTLRGFMIQRLLWETGNIVGYFPSDSKTKMPRLGTKQLNRSCEQTEDFVQILTAWQCKDEISFFTCIISLSKKLERRDYLTKDDVTRIEAWLQNLKSVGYKEPSRVNYTKLEHGATAVIDSRLRGQTDTSSPFVKTIFCPPIANKDKGLTYGVDQVSINMVNHTCRNVSNNLTTFLRNPTVKRYDNIVLIVVFNFPHYGNVPYLDLMYRPFFKHIVYCGTNKSKYMTEGHVKRATFIEVNVFKGFFGYRCMVQVMRMNYDVEGYLHLGDDVLLNVWNLHRFPRNRMWLYVASNLNTTRKTPRWHWAERRDVGRVRYNVALNATAKLNQTKWRNFLRQMKENTGAIERITKGAADIMYVPKRFKDDVLYFLDHFSKFNLFLEIAFPTVFSGLEKLTRIARMSGTYLWTSNKRNNAEAYFNKTKLFLHPFKLSRLKQPKGQKLFCEKFLPMLYGANV